MCHAKNSLMSNININVISQEKWNLRVRCLQKAVNTQMRLQVENENVGSSSRMYTCFGKFGGHMVHCDPDHTLPYRTWEGLHLRPLCDDIYFRLGSGQNCNSRNICVHSDLPSALWERKRKATSTQISSGGIQCKIVAMVFSSYS